MIQWLEWVETNTDHVGLTIPPTTNGPIHSVTWDRNSNTLDFEEVYGSATRRATSVAMFWQDWSSPEDWSRVIRLSSLRTNTKALEGQELSPDLVVVWQKIENRVSGLRSLVRIVRVVMFRTKLSSNVHVVIKAPDWFNPDAQVALENPMIQSKTVYERLLGPDIL